MVKETVRMMCSTIRNCWNLGVPSKVDPSQQHSASSVISDPAFVRMQMHHRSRQRSQHPKSVFTTSWGHTVNELFALQRARG